MRDRLRLIPGLMGLLLLAGLAGLQPLLQPIRPAQAAALGTEALATVARVEDYLNGLQTLHSRFVQVNSYGAWAEGELHLKRPGKLRFEYDDPHPILMIADGSRLLYYDKSLKAAAFVPLKKTPLRFLTSKRIELTDDAEIVEVAQKPSSVEITLRDKSGGLDGTVTLILEDKPLQLRKWWITYEDGVIVEVALINPSFGVGVDNDVFDYSELDVHRIREMQMRRGR